MDAKLAYVLFVLDICDTADQIFNILDEFANLVGGIANYQLPNIAAGQAGTRGNPIHSIYNEYKVRPVSAIVGRALGKDDGDCVETLYRHLINIAIQDYRNLSKLYVERLLEELKKYYEPYN